MGYPARCFTIALPYAHLPTAKTLSNRRPKAATYLCRFAAKARFDNRLNPRGEVSKGRGRDPSLLVVSRLGDFQGGREIEIPLPLNRSLDTFFRQGKKVTRRRHKKKNHRRCEKNRPPCGLFFFTPALISHLAVSPAAPAARPRCCRCRGCAPPGSNGSFPPPVPPPRRRRGIRPARPARG